MLKDITSLIIKHTAVSRHHLTPELALRLITPGNPLWTARADDVPFEDPFWAFYWPGGQAAARYILDNKEIVTNRRVIDIGCGCGAGAIAAAKMNATEILANDIDPFALEATKLNASLNGVSVRTSGEDLIGRDLTSDVVLVGDMFYDEHFSNMLFEWLKNLADNGKTVLIGDPGRHGLTARRRSALGLVARYQMPPDSCLENRGFTETKLWRVLGVVHELRHMGGEGSLRM